MHELAREISRDRYLEKCVIVEARFKKVEVDCDAAESREAGDTTDTTEICYMSHHYIRRNKEPTHF